MAMYDALIIGCGMSGLAAARQLAGTPFRLAMLEGRERLGGRIETAHRPHGLTEPVDLGGSMVHGLREGNPVGTLITRDLGMEVHVPEGAKGIVCGEQGPLAEADATALLATSAQNAFVPQPGTSPSVSVADRVVPQLAHDPRLLALARTAEIGAGVTLEEQSARWAGFEQGFKGTDGFPVGGYGEVIENLASDVKAGGGEIHLGEVVTAVEDVSPAAATTAEEAAATGGASFVRVTTAAGNVYTARTVISTIPHAVLQARPPKFSPALPASFTSALERMRTGALEKVVLSYPRAWWPAPAENGSFLLLPLPTTADAAAPPGSLAALFASIVIPVTSFERMALNPHPTLLAYIGANAARVLAKFSTDEIAEAFHAYLVQRLAPPSGSAPVPAPTTKLVTTWLTDPFSLGATSAPITITTSSADGEPSTPLDYILVSRPAWDGRLGFAGEHTDLDNHGSVAGAFISGRREGMRVRELLERGQ